ncbi:MAG TPA: M48 family metallopeptidase [Candidatus Krumholzibacterium sp.]|nr:M48 family metallopeptidase [Candidatus Krumholzibacterium sp.]
MKGTILGRAWAMLALVTAAAMFSGGCATTGINQGQINIISSSEEVGMGQGLSVEVEKEFPVLPDADVNAYVQRVGERLARVSDRPEIEYHFKVIDKDELNAFALPGGYIYIYTGLMSELDDEAQLAGVLAHEIGHVTARHSTERLTTMYGYQIVAGLLLGENPNMWAELVANIFSTGGFLAYSRKNEFEADRLGVKYASTAGYDPRGVIELLGKLRATQEREPGKLEELLSTHPPTSARIAEANAVIGSYTAGGERNRAAYEGVKKRLP